MDNNIPILPTRDNFFSSLNTGMMGNKTKPNDSSSPDQQATDDNHCIVCGTFAFIMRVSSFFGMAPLRFSPHRNGYAVSISKHMCVYSFLLVTALAMVTFSGVVSQIARNQYLASHLLQFVSWCDVIVAVVMASVGVYAAPSRMRSMLKLMRILDFVDKSFGVQYSHTRERSVWAVLILFLIFTTVLVLDETIGVCSNLGDWDSLCYYVGQNILWYIAVFLEVQFAITAMSVLARFQAINEALSLTARHISVPNTQITKNPESINVFTTKDFSKIESAKVTVIVTKSVTGEPRLLVSPSDAVHLIASLYGKLCDVVHRINSGYGISLILMLTSNLFHLIKVPYFTVVVTDYRRNSVHFITFQCLMVTLYVLKLFLVVEPCHYTIEECRKTESIVCRMLLMSPTSSPLSDRLEMFLRQLMMQPLSYSPMGLCTLDRPLIASIFGAVVTYLVILIQFHTTSD